MKHLLFATSVALVFALQPVQAQEQDAAKAKDANTQETIHAPTNRVGEAVPTMTAEPDAPAGDKKAETVHPPTNRVGNEVPTMKSAENKDDQSSSKTYYNKDDKKTTQ